jgi:probable F420-dependent oxidoreductase
MHLQEVGVWAPELRNGEESARREAAAQLDELGYGTLWFPGSGGGDSLECAAVLLDATTRAVVATGITNIWTEEPADVAREHAALAAAHDHRFLLGLGISHRPLVDRVSTKRYDKPFSAMVSYLDDLDAAPTAPPIEERVIAALGPKMLEVSRDRAAGTHPYLVTPEHTRIARAAVGPDKHVAPEQGVVLERDPDKARALAREFLKLYLPLPNYFKTWERLGFTEDDRRDGGSDRLVDALIAWGDEDAIAARVREHLDAGADHVCLQVIHDEDGLPTEQWRRLADALIPRT